MIKYFVFDTNCFISASLLQDACIITGDADLLELHPFKNIPILNAFAFLSYEL